MSTLAGSLMGLAFGFGSALVPLFNSEAYAVATVASAAGSPSHIAAMIVALALGQTAGKLVLFEAARRGSTRLKTLPKIRSLPSGRWPTRIQRALQQPRTALPMVLTSAGFGLPPLALVSVAAGAAGQPRRSFALMCFVGRTARFSAIAAPVAFVFTRA